MVLPKNGTKVVLTAYEIEMRHFGEDPFGAFAGSFLLRIKRLLFHSFNKAFFESA